MAARALRSSRIRRSRTIADKNGNNDPVLAELVEVLEIERIIEHLIDISLNDAGLTNLEFKTEDYTA